APRRARLTGSTSTMPRLEKLRRAGKCGYRLSVRELDIQPQGLVFTACQPVFQHRYPDRALDDTFAHAPSCEKVACLAADHDAALIREAQPVEGLVALPAPEKVVTVGVVEQPPTERETTDHWGLVQDERGLLLSAAQRDWALGQGLHDAREGF